MGQPAQPSIEKGPGDRRAWRDLADTAGSARGGSPDSRKILPKIGYQHGGVMKRYVRVVRPWLQLRTRPQQDWKNPLRFLRNSASSINPLPPFPPGWQVSKVSGFDSSIEPSFAGQDASSPVHSRRTARGLNHLLDCPAAEFSGFVVSGPGGLFGYFVLVRIGRQARIVDLQVNRENRTVDSSNDWPSICSVAV